MRKQRMSQLRRKTHRRLRCKVLGAQCAHKTYHRQQDQDSAHLIDVGFIAVFYTFIDNRCHYKRHQKVKKRLQHFKQRRNGRFFFIIL